jgi:Bromodomain
VLSKVRQHEFINPDKRPYVDLYQPVAVLFPSIADDYLGTIQDPMDIAVIQQRLSEGRIAGAQEFVNLMLLVFNNAIQYNMPAAKHALESAAAVGGVVDEADLFSLTVVKACEAVRATFRWWALEELVVDSEKDEDKDKEVLPAGVTTIMTVTNADIGSAAEELQKESVCILSRYEKGRQRRLRRREVEPQPVGLPDNSVINRMIKPLQRANIRMYNDHFAAPVDLAFAPNYLQIVARPMDLGTVQDKIRAKDYTSYDNYGQLFADLQLVFDNAVLYNSMSQDFVSVTIFNAAQELLAVLGQLIDTITVDIMKSTLQERVEAELGVRRRERDRAQRLEQSARRAAVKHEYERSGGSAVGGSGGGSSSGARRESQYSEDHNEQDYGRSNSTGERSLLLPIVLAVVAVVVVVGFLASIASIVVSVVVAVAVLVIASGASLKKLYYERTY